MRRIAVSIGIALLPLLAPAAEPPGELQPVEPPPVPEPVRSGETLEPEVTIIERGEEVVREYRIGGELYMIRVEPRRGAPYYLVDTDGDGSLETRQSELTGGLLIPRWILHRW